MLTQGDYMHEISGTLMALLTCATCYSYNQQAAPEPQDLITIQALAGVMTHLSSHNAAASYLNNPAVIPVKQCADVLNLTRDSVTWPEGWESLPDPNKPKLHGMLNCRLSNGSTSVPLRVAQTGY
jgi:hypothetical protein